jgi:hypothetical protein
MTYEKGSFYIINCNLEECLIMKRKRSANCIYSSG